MRICPHTTDYFSTLFPRRKDNKQANNEGTTNNLNGSEQLQQQQ